MSTLFAFSLGGPEVILILVVILIFFGARRIPELARSLGKGMREFKDATKEVRDEINQGGVDIKDSPRSNQNSGNSGSQN